MKTTRFYSYLFFIISLVSGCDSDFLNPNNPTAITTEDVWKDEVLIEMFVNRMYNDLPGYEYSNTLDNIADEGRCNYPGDTPNRILLGQWDASANPIGFWFYDRVRRANDFFANIEDAPISEEVKARLKGEVRLYRALTYFEIVKRYGGVPIIETAQSLEDDLEVSRNSLDECFEFIDRELEIAANELPVSAPRGKASQGAALALRGRVALFFASPLYNGQNIESRWVRAAELNRGVIDLQWYALYPDLGRLWLESGNHSEAIFEVQYKLPEKQHSWDAGLRPLRLANLNAGQLSPLQELVDAFPMKNGLSIGDPSSGFDPSHPYEERDDRFYAFIAFNGSKMYGTNSGPPVQEITLEIYSGGIDFDASPENKIYNTITGYYTRKATNPENTIYRGRLGSDQPWIEIRYAEVLLNYAEAMNEALSTPDVSVYETLNMLRRRAGITQDLQVGSLTKEQMRDLIRNERYIELCFEQKRYWDIRRWKLAMTLLNGKVYSGVFITKRPNGEFTYEYMPVDAQPNIFAERMYWMPIPQDEIAKNRNLEQNPGW